jgi:hypothetical protein
MLEWRLARSDLINYSGDLMTPPGFDLLSLENRNLIRVARFFSTRVTKMK